MSDFLDKLSVNPGDEVGKNWISAALVLALPDPEDERELTHLREAVIAAFEELERRAARTRGETLDLRGRQETEPLLALAVVAATTGFVDSAGRDGRRQLFRAIFEVAASVDRSAVAHVTADAARALRMELELLNRNPNAREAMPGFASAWELLDWFPAQTDRFAAYVIQSWTSKFAPALRLALLTPRDRPSFAGLLDDDEEEPASISVGKLEDAPSIHRPLDGWLIPEPTDALEIRRSDQVREELLQSTLATITPLSRFANTSPSVLGDREMAGELQIDLREIDRALDSQDLGAATISLARALVAATATPPAWVERLRWAGRNDEVPRHYPGVITIDAAWLMRPEWRPENASPRREFGALPIPLSKALRERLLRLGAGPRPGEPVLPLLADKTVTLTEATSPGRATLSQLFRTPISRLMRTEPYGISIAQHVAGNDFGLDDAVLHYDRLAANQVAATVSEITFRWFGDTPRDHPFPRPTHAVGSRRVVALGEVTAYLDALRRGYAAAVQDGPWQALRQRMRYDVHGLALMCGHRANDAFGRITAKHLSLVDPIGTVSDKEVSCDWLLRPIGLTKRWQQGLQSLLAHLQIAADQYPGTALAAAASAALAGTGPLFLDINSPDHVEPFTLRAYQEGLPPALIEIDNFARQLVNFHLTGKVPESLRVAQLGWHGTREGAWADGSPWSALEAARELQPALDDWLKRVGWRPLSQEHQAPAPLQAWPLQWADAERNHVERFRRDLKDAKLAMARRHAVVAEKLRPELSSFLDRARIGVVLTPTGGLAKVDASRDSPVPLAFAASAAMIRAISGGDARSLEARVGRNLVVDLLRQARDDQVVVGPLPRRFHWRWPSRPGPFLAEAPTALAQARQLDERIARNEVAAPVRTAVSLLLHGPLADVEIILAVLRPGARLSTLQSAPGVLLVEPAPIPGALDTDDAETGPSNRNCLAFHGLAALHLWGWHRSRPERAPDESDLDAALLAALPTIWCDRIRNDRGKGALQEVAALARACNSLRQDGIARQVGTERVRLTCVSLDRVIAARDGHRLRARRDDGVGPSTNRPGGDSPLPETAPHPTMLKDLFDALTDAAQAVDADAAAEGFTRAGLIAWMRSALTPLPSPSPSALVVRFVLTLLERGGRQGKPLVLATIRDRAYSVGRFLDEAFPADPLRSEAGVWEEAYLAIVAETPMETRVRRAQDLAYFHRVLGEEITVPDVDLSAIYALAGSASEEADAGFLTDWETDALMSALARDITECDASGQATDELHLAKARELAARLSLSSAARPGEVARLRFADTNDASRLRIRRTRYQRLKSFNARRSARLRGKQSAVTEQKLAAWRNGTRARLRSDYADTMPIFHQLEDSRRRLSDAELYARIGRLIRWATGDRSARTYWLRKTGIRWRLEEHMHGTHRSLWALRDLLAEIAHGEVIMTLRSYTHDPVTAFLRWFASDPAGIDIDRLSIAVGRSRSRVSRQHDQLRVRRHGAGATSRMTLLLSDAPRIEEDGSGDAVEFPRIQMSGRHNDYPFDELLQILRHVAEGASVPTVLEHHHWPVTLAPRLEAVLSRLKQDHAIVLGRTQGADEDVLVLPAPRALSNHGGIPLLASMERAPEVLAEMGDEWLSLMRLGLVEGVPTTEKQWSAWEAALPALTQIAWDERMHGRALSEGSLAA